MGDSWTGPSRHFHGRDRKSYFSSPPGGLPEPGCRRRDWFRMGRVGSLPSWDGVRRSSSLTWGTSFGSRRLRSSRTGPERGGVGCSEGRGGAGSRRRTRMPRDTAPTSAAVTSTPQTTMTSVPATGPATASCSNDVCIGTGYPHSGIECAAGEGKGRGGEDRCGFPGPTGPRRGAGRPLCLDARSQCTSIPMRQVSSSVSDAL